MIIRSLLQSYLGKKQTSERVRADLINALLEERKKRSLYAIHKDIRDLISYSTLKDWMRKEIRKSVRV
jgi:hypothetical protein